MILKLGSKGEEVKALQSKLGIAADGDFGPGTEKIVKEWQTKNGLTADGIIGPASMEKLGLSASVIKEDVVIPKGGPLNLEKLKGHIPEAVIVQIPTVMEKFQINTPLRLAHFLAQCGHESGGFKATQENLNYSADGLKKIFPKYFPGNIAESYARNPEKIASKVYGGARLDEFIVTPEQSKTIVQSGKGYIYIWMIGTTKEVHKDIPRVSISKNNEVVYQGAPKVASGLLLVLDACGNKVTQIPEGSTLEQPSVDSWISKLVADRSKINVKEKITTKIDSKEVLLKNSGKLVDLITNLETYLKTNIFKGINKTKEAQEYYTFRKDKANLINQTYFDVYQILQSNNWARKDPFKDSYSNKFVGGDMGGDIKLDLDKFYDTFNKIYYNDTDSVYIPNGIAGANSITKKLGIKYS